MSTANLTRTETRRRSRHIDGVKYLVDLNLLRAEDTDVDTFESVTTIEFDATTAATWVDFIGAAVDEVTVNGTAAQVDYDGARIQLVGLADHNVVRIRARGRYSRSGEGLHRFIDPVDDNVYLYTQYEPADARRVFANFEQPDLKASFTLRVTAPPAWTVLSNRAGVTDGTVTTFAPTLPISTYITAVAAGPYHGVESSWTRGDLTVPLGAYCRASLAEYFDAEDIFDITERGLDFFHDKFDYPYPFGKYDQIFVPEYNLGAMENPGLVTFTESYVFRSAATEAQYEARANTILHEMAHMWFGDLVTMQWWDDLWLKESFADYMGAYASAEATRFTDAWVSFANRRKAWAYLQDQLPTTHPIVADITDLEAAKLNFDGITYAKGASVLKQLGAFVGADAFFAASRNYFRTHAFGNTTLTDLLSEMSTASGRDLETWAGAWLQTTGVSTLTYTGDAVEQTDPRPHRIAVGLYDPDEAGNLTRTHRYELDITDSRTPVDFPDSALVLLNDDDLTYAKIRFDERSTATVRTSLDRIVDPLARGLVWSALWNSIRDAELSAIEYLDIATRFAPTEPKIGLLSAVTANVAYTLAHYLPEDRRDEPTRHWLEASWRQLQSSEPGSDAQLVWARAVASAAQLDDFLADDLRSLLDGTATIAGLRLDPDQRWAFWLALAATGHATIAELDAELGSDDTLSGRTAHTAAATAIPDATVKASAWTSITERDDVSNDVLDAYITGFGAGHRPDLTQPYEDRYFESISSLWTSRSIEIARRIVVRLFPQQSSTDSADVWLAEHEWAPAALRRLVIEQRDHLARSLRVQARLG
ncbi:aminopeptidase N [Rhodococcoides fascians]|uniref:Aminopeptidase N n=1 Tax=Rhodococcoides fascians TaxID=1828 RepID=A0A143QG68_RHOFA|nr:aminopeptidase N [Rhodococcus fascians]AMY21836.1 Aminopeptidase N [Rhodococcus fascians]OZC42004.1 aminopeptidase N [Rhodococcus fascians]